MAFLKKASHPAIMPVIDDGLYLGRYPFFVAEYYPQTLSDVMKASHKLPVVKQIAFALQLMAALTYLETHSPQIVHRDIKPKNIFIKANSCVLGDFGLLKTVEGTPDDRQRFKESVGFGMPRGYRTPDLVSYLKGGAPPTTKSDVFQLGLVLAELFTGRNPLAPCKNYEDDVALESIASRKNEPAAEISNLIHSMLALEPSARASASTLVESWESLFFSAARKAAYRSLSRVKIL
jgi:serine/threonine protein kinase